MAAESDLLVSQIIKVLTQMKQLQLRLTELEAYTRSLAAQTEDLRLVVRDVLHVG